MNAFSISPAVRKNTPVFIAIAGATGTGKTRSALELATGLAGESGKILFADTEGGRALHYADLYKFDHVEWHPPFTPERNAELIDLAEKRGYAVLVIDSESDEMEGEGGLQEIATSTKDEFWARTKSRHKHSLINRMRRARIHIIFCLRCEERVRIEKVWDERKGKEVTAVIPVGWSPVCEKRFMHEVQSSFLLTPEARGEPQPIKLYDIHERAFPKGQKISVEAGRMLADWAAGGAPSPARQPTIEEQARAAARNGKAALSTFWRELDQSVRHEIKDLVYGELASVAKEVDESRAPLPDDPFSVETSKTEHPNAVPRDETNTGALQKLDEAKTAEQLFQWTRTALAACRDPGDIDELSRIGEPSYKTLTLAEYKEIRKLIDSRNQELSA